MVTFNNIPITFNDALVSSIAENDFKQIGIELNSREDADNFIRWIKESSSSPSECKKIFHKIEYELGIQKKAQIQKIFKSALSQINKNDFKQVRDFIKRGNWGAVGLVHAQAVITEDPDVLEFINKNVKSCSNFEKILSVSQSRIGVAPLKKVIQQESIPGLQALLDTDSKKKNMLIDIDLFYTPVYFAIQTRNSLLISSFLRTLSSSQKREFFLYRSSPLLLAIQTKDREVVEAVIDACDRNLLKEIFSQDLQIEEKLLFAAVETNVPEIYQALAKAAGPMLPALLQDENAVNETPLHYCLRLDQNMNYREMALAIIKSLDAKHCKKLVHRRNFDNLRIPELIVISGHADCLLEFLKVFKNNLELVYQKIAGVPNLLHFTLDRYTDSELLDILIEKMPKSRALLCERNQRGLSVLKRMLIADMNKKVLLKVFHKNLHELYFLMLKTYLELKDYENANRIFAVLRKSEKKMFFFNISKNTAILNYCFEFHLQEVKQLIKSEKSSSSYKLQLLAFYEPSEIKKTMQALHPELYLDDRVSFFGVKAPISQVFQLLVSKLEYILSVNNKYSKNLYLSDFKIAISKIPAFYFSLERNLAITLLPYLSEQQTALIIPGLSGKELLALINKEKDDAKKESYITFATKEQKKEILNKIEFLPERAARWISEIDGLYKQLETIKQCSFDRTVADHLFNLVKSYHLISKNMKLYKAHIERLFEAVTGNETSRVLEEICKLKKRECLMILEESLLTIRRFHTEVSKLYNHVSKTPIRFIDFITTDVMNDPYIVPGTDTRIDKTTINRLLKDKNGFIMNPLTNLPQPAAAYLPDLELKAKITEWMSRVTGSKSF